MSKYDELSGCHTMSLTPFGLLLNVLQSSDRPILAVANNAELATVDGIAWTHLNRKLHKRLLEMADFGFRSVYVCDAYSDNAIEVLKGKESGR